MSREALVLLVCCCDFRDGAERLIPSKSLRNAVIRAFPGLFCILRMCAPRRAAAVVRPRGREKSADRRRRILISRLLIIRASVPRRKSPFPAYFKGFPAVSPLIPPYPAFLKYPVSPQLALAFQMGPHLNNLISSYSHGMKQKLALIAAFSHTPKLLILDEPFVGLDPEAFVILKEQMKELCASGNSVLFSSHILDVVEKVCNKVSVIKHGQLLYSGRTTEIVGTKGLEEVFMEMNGDEISVTPTKE